jgi:hypothetical protein
MSRGCFMSYMLVWDPGDFTVYRVLVFRDFEDDMFRGLSRRCLDDCSRPGVMEY